MKTPKNPEKDFQRVSEILDELISCQRREQDLVLRRKPLDLPILCGRINSLTSELVRHQEALAVPPSQAGEFEAIRRSCREKFETLQALAHQNDLLLEHSLAFLQELVRQALGIRPPPMLYDETGIAPPEAMNTGLLLDQKA